MTSTSNYRFDMMFGNEDRSERTALGPLQSDTAHLIALDGHSPTKSTPHKRGAVDHLTEFVE